MKGQFKKKQTCADDLYGLKVNEMTLIRQEKRRKEEERFSSLSLSLSRSSSLRSPPLQRIFFLLIGIRLLL